MTMKVFLIFVITLLFFIPSFAQRKSHKQEAELLGAVKTVESYYISVWSIGGIQSKQGWGFTNFNRKGNFTERITYDPQGKISTKLTYTFDEKGRNNGIESYYVFRDKPEPTLGKHTYVLDKKGNIIEEKLLLNGKLIPLHSYKYDSKGNKIEGKTFMNGKTMTLSTYKYDAKGNLIERATYRDGIVTEKTDFAYDKKGNQTSSATYYNNQLQFKSTSTYDTKGIKTEQTEWYEFNKLKYRIVTIYDKKERVLEKETIVYKTSPNDSISSHIQPGKVINVYDDKARTKKTVKYKPDGSPEYRIIFAYDNKGNEIGWEKFEPNTQKDKAQFNLSGNTPESKPEFLNAPSSKLKTKIQYDSRGNWTKKVNQHSFNQDGKFFTGSVEVRIITYY